MAKIDNPYKGESARVKSKNPYFYSPEIIITESMERNILKKLAMAGYLNLQNLAEMDFPTRAGKIAVYDAPFRSEDVALIGTGPYRQKPSPGNLTPEELDLEIMEQLYCSGRLSLTRLSSGDFFLPVESAINAGLTTKEMEALYVFDILVEEGPEEDELDELEAYQSLNGLDESQDYLPRDTEIVDEIMAVAYAQLKVAMREDLVRKAGNFPSAIIVPGSEEKN